MEIKSNDLRIGNYVLCQNLKTKVEHISRNWCGYNDTHCTWCHVKPIPLTEEWFYDFGFLIFKSSFEKGEFVVNRIINPEEYNFMFKKLKYVHELQNLYFALTGEELKYD